MSGQREAPRRRPPDDDAYCNEIVLQPDGSVAFKHLTLDLLELAAGLDPEDERVQRRLARAAPRRQP